MEDEKLENEIDSNKDLLKNKIIKIIKRVIYICSLIFVIIYHYICYFLDTLSIAFRLSEGIMLLLILTYIILRAFNKKNFSNIIYGIVCAITILSIIYYNFVDDYPIISRGGALKEDPTLMFNQQFTAYEGTVTGSSVKALLDIVITNNSDETNSQVTVNKEIPTDKTFIPKFEYIINVKRYKVTTHKESNGIISDITIEKFEK